MKMEGSSKYHQANCYSPLLALFLIFILSLSSIFNCATAAGGHNYKDALSKSILFFEGQRSGKLPPDQRLTWRKDSALRDGAEAGVDLTGGYYDAGDNVKFGFPMAFTVTMLAWSVIEFGKDMGSELENALKAVRWGTDYLLKATSQNEVIFVQVGDAYADHNCWQRPEDMDTIRTVSKVDKDHPGSEVAGETAAALAAASIAFKKSDPSYSKILLDRAITVFEFGDKYRGKYSSSLQSVVCPFYCNYNGYEEELLWGAAWLHKASKKKAYSKYIRRNMFALKAGQTPNEFGWDNKHAGINVLLSQAVLMGKSASLKLFQKNAEEFMCSMLPETTDPNYPLYSRGGLIAKPGGTNMQRVTAMSFIVLAYSKYLTRAKSSVQCGQKSESPFKLIQLAKRQVDYILGDNPNRMSYMVGYGSKYPQYIHHRGSSVPSVEAHPEHIQCKEGSKYFDSPDPNPNVLIGAVVGGPNITDSFTDSRPFFEQTEPTTYINAPLVGLLGYFSAHP